MSEANLFARLVHGKGLLGLFKAYMDESGIHAGSPACVVAGFVAPELRCESFEYGWKQLLLRHKLRHFHSKELTRLTGVFSGFTPYAKEKFIADALATLSRSMNDGGSVIVGAAVKTEAFFALSESQRNWLTGGKRKPNGKWNPNGVPKNPYFLPFQQCVVDCAGCMPKGEIVHFIFDQQKNFEPSGRRIFELLTNQHPTVRARVGDIVYTSKKRAILLQVADFIAYEAWQYLAGKRPRVSNDPSRTGAHPIFNRHILLTMIRPVDMARMLRESPITDGQFFKWPLRSIATPERNTRIYVPKV